MEWTNLAQDIDRCRAHVNTIKNLRVSEGVGDWGETESIWHVSHCLAYCTSPG
jgi:NADH:ubiquinone oxidoreductase subunit B-like Fe-S oxidoreductase